MPFFDFHQNNSGGRHRQPAINMVIEAHDAVEANALVLSHGAYFDGVADDLDCECCGDRWYPAFENEAGTDEPTIYGRPMGEWASNLGAGINIAWGLAEGIPEAIVYYLDGRTEVYVVPTD